MTDSSFASDGHGSAGGGKLSAYDAFPDLLTVHHRDEGCRFGHISYVNRTNPLGPALQDVLLKNYARYAFDYTRDLRGAKVDVAGLFARKDNPLHVEIGFGKGDSTFQDALENPDVNFFCFDVYLQGFASLMSKISGAGLNNILLCHYDALDFISRSMTESCVSRFKIFFPDPWPKRKHNKRRLINAQTAELFASKLIAGGVIHAATDIKGYAEKIMQAFSSSSALENVYDGYAPKGIRKNLTSYERKAISEGREIFDIIFKKI